MCGGPELCADGRVGPEHCDDETPPTSPRCDCPVAGSGNRLRAAAAAAAVGAAGAAAGAGAAALTGGAQLQRLQAQVAQLQQENEELRKQVGGVTVRQYLCGVRV